MVILRLLLTPVKSCHLHATRFQVPAFMHKLCPNLDHLSLNKSKLCPGGQRGLILGVRTTKRPSNGLGNKIRRVERHPFLDGARRLGLRAFSFDNLNSKTSLVVREDDAEPAAGRGSSTFTFGQSTVDLVGRLALTILLPEGADVLEKDEESRMMGESGESDRSDPSVSMYMSLL